MLQTLIHYFQYRISATCSLWVYDHQTLVAWSEICHNDPYHLHGSIIAVPAELPQAFRAAVIFLYLLLNRESSTSITWSDEGVIKLFNYMIDEGVISSSIIW